MDPLTSMALHVAGALRAAGELDTKDERRGDERRALERMLATADADHRRAADRRADERERARLVDTG